MKKIEYYGDILILQYKSLKELSIENHRYLFKLRSAKISAAIDIIKATKDRIIVNICIFYKSPLFYPLPPIV